MSRFAPPEPGADLAERVQHHVDELEFQYGAIGETVNYAAYADHVRTQLARGKACALAPRDPGFWLAVVGELAARDAGVITPMNADRARLLGE